MGVTVVRTPDIPSPIPPLRRPVHRLPPGATDCHAHVFGPQSRYPLLANTHFVPHETPWAAYAEMLRSIGCDRAVLVQPSVYGSNNAAIEDALAAADGLSLRAIAVVAPEVSDEELARLDGLGFRGVRVNLAAGTRGLTLAQGAALASRIRHLGWHLQVYADFEAQPHVGELLAALPVPVVIDHLGRAQAGGGVGSPGFQALLQTLRHPHCWAKLSAPYFVSVDAPGFHDVAPLARAMVAVAPDRIVWGTDWPHASARHNMPADADLADMVWDWLPDEAARRRVLVDNPARLYGFATA